MESAISEGHGAGAIILSTDQGEDGSSMRITGIYKQRPQFGIYTVAKALAVLVERAAASGTSGNFATGPTCEPPSTPSRRLPKRLRESTGFGELK
jgi:hypothetical protein